MMARLRRTTWQDWVTPIQVAVGLSLLAIAIASVPGNGETPSRASAHCATPGGCPSEPQ